jgi:hypothetical protein
VRGVSVVGLERGNVLFLDFGDFFDETAYQPMKKSLGLYVLDMIGARTLVSSCAGCNQVRVALS